MKSLLLTLSGLLAAWSVNAQNFVTTTVADKNVVLEEFTGIGCGYCPDGHKRASDYAALHPGRVVLINIHEGSYADPDPGEPDYRTPFGSAIANQADISGYPAGSVNRRNFTTNGWAHNAGSSMNRGYWASAADLIKAENSPVNIAAESTVLMSTNELKVVTETYYTGNAPAATNKLNVVLLQENVPGPQHGAIWFNAANILPNGDYNHNHMLRHMITGQWGTTIGTTTAGTFQADTFNYQIPTGFNGVATNLVDMNVAVFVAEGQEKILTGNYSVMNLITPSGTSIGDLTLEVATLPNYCDNNYIPSVTVTNTGASTIDTFLVSYTITALSLAFQTGAGSQFVYTPLAPGVSTTVTFPAETLNYSTHEVQYEYSFEDHNATLFDVTSTNNAVIDLGLYAYDDPTPDSLIAEDFQTLTFQMDANGWGGTDEIPNTFIENPFDLSVNTFGVMYYDSTATNPMDTCFRVGFFSIAFPEEAFASLVFEPVDMSNINTASLTFDYAHAGYDVTSDCKFDVEVSTDCGGTWTKVWGRSGSSSPSLINAGTSTGWYTVSPQDYESISVDLSAYSNNPEVSVRFKATNGSASTGYGNTLYFRNINTSFSTDVKKIDVLSELRIMPNPVHDVMKVAFSTKEAINLKIQVMNALGQQVQQVATDHFVGFNTLSVNTADLSTGVYFLTITSANGIRTERFIVEK